MKISAVIVFITILLILQIASAVTSPGFSSFGRSVTMNLTFHIGDDKASDIIGYTDKYISSQDSGIVLALVSNAAFGTRYNELQNDYMLEMRQPVESSFFLVFTKGNEETIANKAQMDSIAYKTFGDLTEPSVTSFPLYLRLEYNNIALLNRTRWKSGSREIIIRNEGENEQGQSKISIELIK